MQTSSGSLREWIYPILFLACCSWVVWQLPAFILDIIPPASDSLKQQITAIFLRYDVSTWSPRILGGHSDLLDWIALIGIPLSAIFGIKNLHRSHLEIENFRRIDKIAVFLGRVTMMMIATLTLVMLYEVFVRYALERPTSWANELTLWFAGFVFLVAGLYAMQQRSHIRIVLLYDAVPRNWQRVFDCISTFMIVVFAVALVFGSYSYVFYNKLYKWELYGSAFNPPIPATLQPMVIIVITLVAIQAVINLISDWNTDPADIAVDEIEEEVASLKKSLGTE